jgi:fatty acid desaturase
MTPSNESNADSLTMHALVWLAVVAISLTWGQLTLGIFFSFWPALTITLVILAVTFVQVSTGENVLDDAADGILG